MAADKTPVSELQPGMVLAQQIQDDKGRTIMPEGARLTPMHIKRLEKWGVDSVLIDTEAGAKGEGKKEDAGKAALQAASSEDRDKMRSVAVAVQERFSNIGDNPVMNELKRLTVRHLVLKGGESIPGLD